MERKNFKIRFLIKESKRLQNGEAPLYVRITLNKERTECSIFRSINIHLWDNIKQRVKGNTPQIDDINKYIDSTRNHLYNCYWELEKGGKEVTVGAIKSLFVNGVIHNDKIVLLDYIDKYISKLNKLVNIDITSATLQRYIILQKFFKLYLTEESKTHITLDEINGNLIPDFIFYLKSTRHCQHNTVVKYVRGISRIIRQGIKEGHINQREDVLNLSIRAIETIPEYLTKDELNAIILKDIDIERLAVVKDVFVFCCFTGLSFIDVKQLKSTDIEKDNKGNLWIRKNRQKTGQSAHIILLKIPLQILDKYKEHTYCKKHDVLLPVLSNQRQNAYLKEIGDICGIKKNLVTHCARHTFATTVTLANNISMETVSKMLGHSDIRMTKHYAKILDETVAKEMKKLKRVWK